jgi:hypothetical protein
MSINETLQKLQAEVAKGMVESTLQKTLTTTSNIVNYDLQAPAKNLYPVITPLRNRIPRVMGNGGRATNWKAIFGLTGSGVPSMGWVAEGQRSGRMNYSAVDKAASYRTIGEEDSITEEAINAAMGFEDAMSRMTMRLLQGTMIKEEFGILGGNASTALGTPGTITTTQPTVSGATLAADTYTCEVVALTLEGWIAAGAVNGAASGSTIAQAATIQGADGKTYNLNGGSSALSASQTQAITLGKALGLTVPAIKGAVAYAWFIGGVGKTPRLEYITTINSVQITAPLAGTGQLDSTITADCSRNANLAFDGLFYSALASGSSAYLNTLATGTAGTGTVLTAGGRRNVSEIDVMLKSMWDTSRITPTVILVSSQELNNITTKVMNTSTTPLLLSGSQSDPYAVVANGQVTGYFNPFTAGQGGVVIPLILHPNVPPGTILAWAENLPAQFQSNETPNVAEMHIRKEYAQTFWPQITRERAVGVYVEETLAVYASFGMGVITNIANG